MKVKDLIEKLQRMPDDMEVYYGYTYGDYWHTQVAGELRSVHTNEVVHSDYHGMMKVVDRNRDRDEDEDEYETITAVVLE